MEKLAHKYLINIKPAAPKLNIYIKTHKNNEPIRPVINNTQAPPYKIAKYLNKKLHNLMCLPYTYNTKKNSQGAILNVLMQKSFMYCISWCAD